MAKQEIQKTFTYEGLGFPVILHNAPMVEVRGIWTLDIDLNILQKVVLLSLAHQPTDLSGNQIYFIRTWLGLSQTQFSHLLGVTHPAIVKWEKAKDSPAKISLTTQRDLRLLLLDKLLGKDKDFRQAFRLIHSTVFTDRVLPLEFDVPTDLAAI